MYKQIHISLYIQVQLISTGEMYLESTFISWVTVWLFEAENNEATKDKAVYSPHYETKHVEQCLNISWQHVDGNYEPLKYTFQYYHSHLHHVYIITPKRIYTYTHIFIHTYIYVYACMHVCI